MNVEVMKMVGCGDISLGFVAYICLKCLELFKYELTLYITHDIIKT